MREVNKNKVRLDEVQEVNLQVKFNRKPSTGDEKFVQVFGTLVNLQIDFYTSLIPNDPLFLELTKCFAVRLDFISGPRLKLIHTVRFFLIATAILLIARHGLYRTQWKCSHKVTDNITNFYVANYK